LEEEEEEESSYCHSNQSAFEDAYISLSATSTAGFFEGCEPVLPSVLFGPLVKPMVFSHAVWPSCLHDLHSFWHVAVREVEIVYVL
jgi:hypothetical protein